MKLGPGSVLEFNLARAVIKKGLDLGNIPSNSYLPFPQHNLYGFRVRNLLRWFLFMPPYILEGKGGLRLSWPL